MHADVKKKIFCIFSYSNMVLCYGFDQGKNCEVFEVFEEINCYYKLNSDFLLAAIFNLKSEIMLY